MKEYTVIIEKAKGNFSAYSPDVDGCVAVGATVEETRQNFQEALEFHLDGLRRMGVPVPEPTTIVDKVSVAA